MIVMQECHVDCGDIEVFEENTGSLEKARRHYIGNCIREYENGAGKL